MHEETFTTKSGKQYTLGQKIVNLDMLMSAATLKLSVIVPKSMCWDKPRPAIFMINQIGGTLYRLFQSGMFVYVKKPKTKKSDTSPS